MSFRSQIINLLEEYFKKKGVYDHYAFQNAEEMLVRAFMLGQQNPPRNQYGFLEKN